VWRVFGRAILTCMRDCRQIGCNAMRGIRQKCACCKSTSCARSTIFVLRDAFHPDVDLDRADRKKADETGHFSHCRWQSLSETVPSHDEAFFRLTRPPLVEPPHLAVGQPSRRFQVWGKGPRSSPDFRDLTPELLRHPCKSFRRNGQIDIAPIMCSVLLN